MTINSLRFRLLASTAALLAIVLPITALALTSYYRLELERGFDQRLKAHLDSLVAISLGLDTSGLEGGGRKRIELGNPLFKRPFSGWYWQIRLLGGTDDNTVISDSLLDQRIPSLLVKTDGKTIEPGLRRGYVDGPEGQLLRVAEQVITSDSDARQERYSYLVAIKASELEEQVAQFRNLLLLSLGLLGLGLVLAALVQIRYGLAPLQVISRRLNDIRTGKSDHLTGTFPAEIEPLQIELNALIRSNRDIVERARTHVGNLAHALKTPLSVISNETEKMQGVKGEGADTAGFVDRIEQQTRLMRDQVRHHLDRARMAAKVGTLGSATRIEPVVAALGRTLQKIYRERQVAFQLDCPADLHFQGEKQDLEEMLGNLLDNAFKYAESKVRLGIAVSSKRTGYLEFIVDDDGPGLSADKRRTAMQRGQRLDEKHPGSGLGLSIVADLAHMYEGDFRLGTAPLGGLQAQLTLPLARVEMGA